MNNGTNGWTVQSNGRAEVTTRGHSSTAELMDDDHLCVEVEDGRGYMAQATTTYIPIEVLAELLRQAGWTCTAPEDQ